MSLDHGYPYQHPMMPYHGGGYPGYGGVAPHHAAYMNPYAGGHHGFGGYGHPGYGGGMPYGGGHHGYAPHMMPYDPRAFPPYEERRKTKAPEPGHRFSSPQHSQKTGKGSDFRF